MKTKNIFIGLVVLSLLEIGCGQEQIVWPDSGVPSVGECGSDYPTGPYGLKEGDTIKCNAWTKNVRIGDYKNPTKTDLDLKALSAQYKSGDFDAIKTHFGFTNASVNPKYLVIVSVAEGCSSCHYVTEGLAGKKDELETHGTLLVATCTGDMSGDKILSTEESEDILKGDGWLDSLIRLQDTEKNLGKIANYPFTYIIRLSDMKILAVGDGGVLTEKTILDIIKKDDAK